jgi:hypothetical protein
MIGFPETAPPSSDVEGGVYVPDGYSGINQESHEDMGVK